MRRGKKNKNKADDIPRTLIKGRKEKNEQKMTIRKGWEASKL